MNNRNKTKIFILSLLSIALLFITANIKTDINNNNIISDKKIIIDEDIQENYDNTINNLKDSDYWDLTGTPIEINGTAIGIGANNWTWAKSKPWCNGNGTLSEPYIIENVTINGQRLDGISCITILNSNVHFIIRNCIIYNSGTIYSSNDAGIKLVNVSNGTIVNNYCSNNSIGINLIESSYNIISGNTIYNNSNYGIHLVDNSDNNEISENSINENIYSGILVYSRNSLICEDNIISKNNVSNNDEKGIAITSSSDNNITENILSHNGKYGAYLFDSLSNNIYKNYFIENEVHAGDDSDPDLGFNYWNSPIIGNYWDNHSTGDIGGNGIDDNAYTYIKGFAGAIDNLPIHGNPLHYGEKIHIDGNAPLGNKSWTWTSTRAWCSGSGDLNNPYIISELKIDAGGVGSSILIGNSSIRYFKIEKCKLINSGSSSMDSGIKLENVNKAELIDNNCSNNNCGISLYLSDNNNISENILQENTYGICLNYSDGNTITKNTFIFNGEYAIEENCVGNIFENNYCLPPLTITNITSTNSDGIYRYGDEINITITFSDIVYITDTPQLILNATKDGVFVDYTSGSGTDTLLFNYTVGLDQYSDDLDYNSSDALILNGGKIKGIIGNDANLTLPKPGSTNSLSYNKDIRIDTRTPSVINITSTKPNGIYSIGEEINITITFSKLVNVTGIPRLNLNASYYNAIAYYIDGNNTYILIFSYIVTSGHNSLNLDYNSTNALNLNGGTITDSKGFDVDLTLPNPGSEGSLSYNKKITIDTDDPTGSITIDAGADWTTSTDVELTLTFYDATSGVDQVRYRNEGESWGTWEPASGTKSWTLTSG
ncbi:MAG: NosD domain-containing protein, partial [Promethearchaeota archaeon]